MGFQTRRIEANGIAYHLIDEGGQGPAVLLLHGFPDTSSLWRGQIPALVAAGFRAIVPDLRGRGQTQAPTLGIWSSGDNYLTEEPMLRSADLVKGPGGWRYERFEDASHWIPLDQPERQNKLLLESLS